MTKIFINQGDKMILYNLTFTENKLPISKNLGPGRKILNILRGQKKTNTDKRGAKDSKKPNKQSIPVF